MYFMHIALSTEAGFAPRIMMYFTFTISSGRCTTCRPCRSFARRYRQASTAPAKRVVWQQRGHHPFNGMVSARQTYRAIWSAQTGIEPSFLNLQHFWRQCAASPLPMKMRRQLPLAANDPAPWDVASHVGAGYKPGADNNRLTQGAPW